MLYQMENPHGGDIYGGEVRLDFSANTNPFGTPEAVQEAVRESLCDLHRYPDPHCRALVSAIAAHEHMEKEQILCGNGAAELIFSYCEAISAKTALELAPTFSEYRRAFTRLGGRMEQLTLSERNGFLPGEELLEAIEGSLPEAVFLCNPNNPTGRLMPPDLLRKVLALTRRLGIRLFLDECFLDLTEAGQSLVPMLGDNPHLTILKAFTKSYGMAGLRLGYVLTADKGLLRRMSETVQPWNVSTPAQRAGIAALGEGAFLRSTLEFLRQEKSVLSSALEALGLRVYPSDANFLLLRGPEGLSEALRSRGILIRSCGNYPGLSGNFYRIAVRLPAENRQLLAELSELMEDPAWQKTS